MKATIKIILLVAIVISWGCEQCGECFTPPSAFRFEIVDKATGENLFSNGTFNSSDIKIVNLSDDSNVEYTFIDENDINLIQNHTIGWGTEIINYSFRVGNAHIFNLYVDAERVSEDCCSYTKLNEVGIENSEFELDSKTGIYRIFVE